MTAPPACRTAALLPAALLAATLLLQGCAGPARLVTNDKASDEIKAKSFKAYKEVLLIPPKDDPRNVVARVASGIEGLGFKVRVVTADKPIEAAQGTGFVISAGGLLLTCAHVVGDSKEATISLNGHRLFADVVKADKAADLALLKLRDPLPEGTPVLGFRAAAKPAVMGEDVFTIGYPLSRMLGNSARMTKGLLSATAGLRDNDKEVQVSAEIQPGNSGGPLLDREGNVIGVVNKTINPASVVQATGGALPQNVNFAIKDGPVLEFVKGADGAAFDGLQFDRAAGLEAANKAVVKVQAGIVPPDADRFDKMVVRVGYVGYWDFGYRFRAFLVTAYDYDTQEPLFAAGQGRGGLLGNAEDDVIQQTLDQFRKAISAR